MFFFFFLFWYLAFLYKFFSYTIINEKICSFNLPSCFRSAILFLFFNKPHYNGRTFTVSPGQGLTHLDVIQPQEATCCSVDHSPMAKAQAFLPDWKEKMSHRLFFIERTIYSDLQAFFQGTTRKATSFDMESLPRLQQVILSYYKCALPASAYKKKRRMKKFPFIYKRPFNTSVLVTSAKHRFLCV